MLLWLPNFNICSICKIKFNSLSDDGFVTSRNIRVYFHLFSSISGFDVWLKLLTSSKMELFGLVFIKPKYLTQLS